MALSVCSICREVGHSAPTCNSELLRQSIARMKAYWLGENMPEGWTDERVKEWAESERKGLPYWRRMWKVLGGEYYQRRRWHGIPDIRDNPLVKFIRDVPRSVPAFKDRVRTYVRPPGELPVAPPRRVPVPIRVPVPVPVPVPRRVPVPVPVLGIAPPVVPRNLQPQIPNIDGEIRHLRRQMEDAIVVHRRRMVLHMQDIRAREDKKVDVVMDALDAAQYFMDPTCPICMTDVTPETVLALGCRHTFCGDCTVESISRTVGCPICRVPVTQIRFRPTTARDTFNKLSGHLSFS